MKTKAISTVIVAAAFLGLGIVALIGCQSEVAEQNAIANRQNATANRLDAEAALKRAEADRARAAAEAAAERERAETDRLQAEAEAYQRRTEAATSAEVERAAIRQAGRDASHERVIETLPFLVLIVGVVTIGALALIVVAGRQQRPIVARDPELARLLQQQAERLAEIERATYHQIALNQRQQLTAGVGYPVIVCDGEGGVIDDTPPN